MPRADMNLCVVYGLGPSQGPHRDALRTAALPAHLPSKHMEEGVPAQRALGEQCLGAAGV